MSIGKPYWSRQHGAYITLIISWLIAVGISDTFSKLQLLVLILLLASLNSVELIMERFTRKTKLSSKKKTWLLVYTAISVIFSGLLVRHLPSLIYFLPFFIISGILFIFLGIRKQQKSVVAEWLTFAVFSMAGLLAYNPEAKTQVSELLVPALFMSLYFGQSIFLVKSRLNKLPDYAALLYSVPVISFAFYLLGFNIFTYLFSVLLLIKSAQTLVSKKWYYKLRIKWVGMLELMYHLVFMILFISSTEIIFKQSGIVSNVLFF